MPDRQTIRTCIHNRHRDRHGGELADATCRDCGSSDALELHHRCGRWLYGRRKNLVILCHQCHTARHRRENTNERIQAFKDRLPG